MRSLSPLPHVLLALVIGFSLTPTPDASAANEWTLYIPAPVVSGPMKIKPEMPEAYDADRVPPSTTDIDDLRSGRVTEREPGMPERVSETSITLFDDRHGDGQKQARAYMRSGGGRSSNPVKKDMPGLPLAFPYLAIEQLPEPWSPADAEGAAWFMTLEGDYSLLIRDEERIWVSSDVRLTFTNREGDASHRHRYRLLSDDDGEIGTYPVGTLREAILDDLNAWLLDCLDESLNRLVAEE